VRVTKKFVVGSFLILKSNPNGERKFLFVGSFTTLIVVSNIALII